MQANLEDTVEDDDALYQKLISKSIDADTSGPESTSSRASGSKVNVPAAAQQKVQVVNSTSIAPDVVIVGRRHTASKGQGACDYCNRQPGS